MSRILIVDSDFCCRRYRSKSALNMLIGSLALEEPDIVAVAIRPGIVQDRTGAAEPRQRRHRARVDMVAAQRVDRSGAPR